MLLTSGWPHWSWGFRHWAVGDDFFYILNFTKVYKMNIGSGRWQKLKKIKKRSFLSEALNFWIIWPGSSQSSSRQQRTFQKDFFILKGQCFQVSSPQYLVWYGFDFANIFVSKARNVCSLYSTVLYVKMLQNKQNVIFEHCSKIYCNAWFLDIDSFLVKIIFN